VNSAVLLLAHGAPERVEDVEQCLGFVRGGRPSNPQITEEVRHRLAAIGGSSPLLACTRTQAEALEKLLGMRVFFGMRNWPPFLAETMEQVHTAGVDRIAAADVTAESVLAHSCHDEPLLIEAFAEKLRPLLAPGRPVLFTAHSLPEKALATGDPYDRETHATAAALAARVGLAEWDFAYQSQGMTDDRWLGPTVESCLDRYAASGVREVVIHPIGFVCDHIEVLFDIDVMFRAYAQERGISLLRPQSLNGATTFTAALAQVVRQAWDHPAR